MTITVVVVGRSRGELEPAVREFEARAGRYWKLQVIEVSAGHGGRGAGSTLVRRAEAERVAARIPEGNEVWALTRDGKGMTSDRFAKLLGDRALHGAPGITFLIGGAFGLDPSLVERASRSLSLSAMTLPHALARCVLAEQLYRAGTILRNEPYHKGGE